MEESGQRYYEAETYRFKGELHLLEPKPDVEQAETSFRRALEIARRQEANSATANPGVLSRLPIEGALKIMLSRLGRH